MGFLPMVTLKCKSHVQVMILGSEEEDEVVTLDESSITSLLAGAGVTITRTTGTSSPAPRTSRPVYVKPSTAMAGMQSSKTTAPIGRQSFKTTTPIGRQARLASSGHGGALLSQQVRPAQVLKTHFYQAKGLCSASINGHQEERWGGGPTGPWWWWHRDGVWQDGQPQGDVGKIQCCHNLPGDKAHKTSSYV